MGNSIQSLFSVEKRFLRSAQLERDFGDPHALDGYVLTDSSREAIERIAMGLDDRSERGHGALLAIMGAESRLLRSLWLIS
jgi:hypothetical protein